MKKREIYIVGSLPYPQSADWDERLRKTFAALGWTVTGYGPTQSATHPEEDYLSLESEGGTIEFATLKKTLQELSFGADDNWSYRGDINGLRINRSRTIDGKDGERFAFLRDNASTVAEIVPVLGTPTKYTRVTLNQSTRAAHGVRFTTPASDWLWNVEWEFVATDGAVKDWQLMLLAEYPNISDRHWLDYQESGADLPRRNWRIVESLTRGELKSATEYFIWFTFETTEPVDMHIRIGLTEADRPKEWHFRQKWRAFAAEEEAFLRSIAENPDDDTPRLVFADWLDEHDDPRGEFIRVQCQLALLPQPDPKANDTLPEGERLLREREAKLFPLAQEAFRWTSPEPVADYFGRNDSYLPSYQRGFMERLIIMAHQLDNLLKHGEALFGRAPVREFELCPTIRDDGIVANYVEIPTLAVEALLRAPWFGQMRLLAIYSPFANIDEVCRLLAASAGCGGLVRLDIHNGGVRKSGRDIPEQPLQSETQDRLRNRFGDRVQWVV
jgi:uncharacterized protein (TIGR02996 family)